MIQEELPWRFASFFVQFSVFFALGGGGGHPFRMSVP